MLVLALAMAAAAPLPAPLLAPDDLVSSQVLPPPPSDGSNQAQAERAELAVVERTRTPVDLASARFAEAIGPRFKLDRLPDTALLMAMIRSTEKAVADRAKTYFRRPRPWIANPHIHACSRNDDALSSYPSGHTTMAFSMGAVLSRLVPERASAIMARAARYGQSRIVCEVHYRSDVTAGEILGLVVAERLMTKPQFRSQFAHARLELHGAQLTN